MKTKLPEEIETVGRCTKTGKSRFVNRQEALDFIAKKNHICDMKTTHNKKRVKHRQGDFSASRAYFCYNCAGWHTTHWNMHEYNDRTELMTIAPPEFFKYKFKQDFQKYIQHEEAA